MSCKNRDESAQSATGPTTEQRHRQHRRPDKHDTAGRVVEGAARPSAMPKGGSAGTKSRRASPAGNGAYNYKHGGSHGGTTVAKQRDRTRRQAPRVAAAMLLCRSSDG